MIPHVVTSSGIVLINDGETTPTFIQRYDKRFDQLVRMLQAQQWDEVREFLVDPSLGTLRHFVEVVGEPKLLDVLKYCLSGLVENQHVDDFLGLLSELAA